MSAPPRYDLISSSCVNNEVVRFNRQLNKRMKTFNNVKILETDLKRVFHKTWSPPELIWKRTNSFEIGCNGQKFIEREENISHLPAVEGKSYEFASQ